MCFIFLCRVWTFQQSPTQDILISLSIGVSVGGVNSPLELKIVSFHNMIFQLLTQNTPGTLRLPLFFDQVTVRVVITVICKSGNQTLLSDGG